MSVPSLLSRAITAMERIAPLSYADHSWDNVGLLVDCPEPDPRRTTVAVCLDISPKVVEECLKRNVGVLIAYHPVIFPNLKKLTAKDPKQLSLLRAIRGGIGIYTPHTALDNCPEGINWWIASGVFQPGHGTSSCYIDEKTQQGLLVAGGCAPPVMLGTVIHRMKSHFKVKTVRVALGTGHTLGTVVDSAGICAGSGASLLRGLAGKVTAVLSGEIDHHTVLSITQQGTTCLLVEHGASERGYVKEVLVQKLRAELRKDMPFEDSDVIALEADEEMIQYH